MIRLAACLLSFFLLTSLSLHPASHHVEDNTPCLTCSAGSAVAVPQAPSLSSPLAVSSLEAPARAVPPPQPFLLPTQARAPPR